MKRVLGILAGATLALVIGCAQSYDQRLEETIKTLEYKRDLENNTEGPPAAKSRLEIAKIYIRPPKGLKGPAKTFPFVIEPGKFEIADSFIDQKSQASLHILARTPAAPKSPAKKGAAPPPAGGAEEPQAPAATRGEFTSDVLDFIRSAYSTDFDASQLKETQPNSHGRKGVTYKSATVDTGTKQVKVYFYGDKNSPAQVALIFDGTKDSLRSLISQIDYSLNSLAVGPRAASLYGGQDEFNEEGPAAAPVF